MSSDEWVLDCSLHELIADEVSIDYSVAGRVVELFNDGNEVAYVARYRKDACGDMTCDQLRRAFKTFNEAKELNKKVGKAIANLTTKIKSENEQKQAIKGLKSARELADVCDITQLYASGRKTKADKARELGLEDVSRDILNGGIVEMSRLVNRSIGLKDIETVEENVVYIIAELLNKMSETIELVKKISHLDSNAVIFVSCELSSKAKKWTVIDKEYSLITHFKDYTKFNRNIQNVENYQVLAMDRGEDKGVLTWKIEVKDIGREHPGKRLRIGKPHINLVQKALKDSISRLFIPKIQRSVRRFLLARAEQAAITCFSRNIGQLFAQEGIQLYNIIALDPGFSACKAAFLAPNGSVLETAEFKLCGHLFDMKGSTILRRWADHSKPGLLIAIGNGKASLETQFAVSVMIKEGKFGKADVKFCVVPENGASKYSITPLAENELPHLPPTQRSAVSIGRRLIDPMAEYIKIEPKHLGMGMYQHSVNEKKLSHALSLAVRECVSMRGVDINSASVQLLQQVCGLNKKTAAGVVALREKQGRINTREELKTVKGLGLKAFQQCAGFLMVGSPTTILDADDSSPKMKKRRYPNIEPLDNTIVHPSQYVIARDLLSRAGLSYSDLGSTHLLSQLSLLCNLNDAEIVVRDLLCAQPKTLPPPLLMTEVRRIGSLHEGEHIWGRVENQVDFGLFIDIGVETKALAHKSVLRKPYPEVGSSRMFMILTVDTHGKRIAVRPLDW